MGLFDGQKVHVNESKRPSDGAKSTSYGPNADSNGKIVDPGKAHLVVDSGGTVAYARNPDGKVIYDSKNDPSYKAPGAIIRRLRVSVSDTLFNLKIFYYELY